MANYPKPRKGSRHNADQHYRSGVRRDLKADRVAQGETRKISYDSLTTAEKIARLDERLGVGVGAKRERARLAKA